jgi:hypothetical protein
MKFDPENSGENISSGLGEYFIGVGYQNADKFMERG